MKDYKLNGVSYPRVSTILDGLGWKTSGLIGWAEMLASKGIAYKDELNWYAERGTAAHTIMELASLDKVGELKEYVRSLGSRGDDIFKMCLPLISYMDEIGVDVIDVEKTIISETLGYGGTVDLVARINGKVWVLDYKTSSKVKKEHVIQISAYKALLEDAGYKIDRAGIVLVKGAKIMEVKSLTEGLSVFNSLLSINKSRLKVKLPKEVKL